jgi:hypothetical protein
MFTRHIHIYARFAIVSVPRVTFFSLPPLAVCAAPRFADVVYAACSYKTKSGFITGCGCCFGTGLQGVPLDAQWQRPPAWLQRAHAAYVGRPRSSLTPNSATLALLDLKRTFGSIVDANMVEESLLRSGAEYDSWGQCWRVRGRLRGGAGRGGGRGCLGGWARRTEA